MKNERMVEVAYTYKGETYYICERAEDALNRLESLTSAGAKIIKVELFGGE